VRLKLASRKIQGQTAILEYALTLDGKHRPLSGMARLEVKLSDKTDEDAISCRSELSFPEPVGADITVRYTYELSESPPSGVFMPRRSGSLMWRPLQPRMAERGKFELGQGAGADGGRELGMPVLDFCWAPAAVESRALRLAVAADPFCGCSISGVIQPEGTTSLTCVTVATTYKGSLVPLVREERTLSLAFHRRGVDGSLRSFYRTIPQIQPGPQWTQGVHLVYYDYLSEKGQGWFKDLQALALRIPSRQRDCVAVCLHGWYDYFQQYAYDHHHKKLLSRWTAFPGTYKVPMSLDDMHQRLKFAKRLGFRTLLYFGDGTNSDSGAPNFRSEYVLKDRRGTTFPGWKGPDSLGRPLKMDPSVPGLRDWYRGYLAALLDEYGKDVDGFVWDETFYIPTGFVSYTRTTPAYADRAMMSLVSELAQMVQQRRAQNADLVFLASDCGQTSYALVAHGTFQDTGCEPQLWGPSLFANYRNCLWSCNWAPVSHVKRNEIAATSFGLPQGVSNGYGDNRGPHDMPAELLDQILRRFSKNVETGRVRARYLNDASATVPRPAPGETNWSLASQGSRARASSEEIGGEGQVWPAAGAIDGLRDDENWGRGHGWASRRGEPLPQWLEVTLPKARSLSRFVVITYYAESNPPSAEVWGVKDYQVQVWDRAAGAWKPVVSEHEGRVVAVRVHVLEKPVRTDKFRVVVNDVAPVDKQARLLQVEAWGK